MVNPLVNFLFLLDVHEKVVHLVMRAPPQSGNRTGGDGGASSPSTRGHLHHRHHHPRLHRRQGPSGGSDSPQVLFGSILVPDDDEGMGMSLKFFQH